MNYKSFNLGDWIGHISGIIEDETTLDGSRVKGFYNFRNKCWYINKLLNFKKQRTVKKIKGWRYLKCQN